MSLHASKFQLKSVNTNVTLGSKLIHGIVMWVLGQAFFCNSRPTGCNNLICDWYVIYNNKIILVNCSFKPLMIFFCVGTTLQCPKIKLWMDVKWVYWKGENGKDRCSVWCKSGSALEEACQQKINEIHNWKYIVFAFF